MKLEWLRYFCEIAVTGSLNKAAENLYLSQPALTKMIHALEKEIGETLLYRKKTGVFLTAHGENFLNFAQNVLDDYQSYLIQKAELQNHEQQYTGTIELVISPSILQTYYQKILTQMRKRFPDITFYCIEADAEDAMKLLSDNVRRLGIIMCVWEDIIYQWKKAGLISQKICQSPVVGCVAKDSYYVHEPSIWQEKIAAEKLISIEFAKKSFIRISDDVCSLRTTNLDMIKQILLSEKNACVLTAQLIAEQKFISADIVAVPVMPAMMASICLVSNQRALEQAVYEPIFFQLMIEIIQQCILPLPIATSNSRTE